MRVAVISDIHGNYEAFKQVLADIGETGVDAEFCLGDIVGYGPEPEASVLRLRREGSFHGSGRELHPRPSGS